jgi:hypothetical protein
VKLDADQLFEVFCALHFGLSAAAWEGASERPWWELTDEEKDAVLTRLKSADKLSAKRIGTNPERVAFNQLLLDRLELTSIRNEEHQEAEYRHKVYETTAAKRRSTSGLRQAINDQLSQSYMFSRSQTIAVERRLAARKLPNLTMLEAILRRKHERILKRGGVRDEEEYYLVQEILASVDFPIDEENRHRLGRFADDFAAKRRSS